MTYWTAFDWENQSLIVHGNDGFTWLCYRPTPAQVSGIDKMIFTLHTFSTTPTNATRAFDAIVGRIPDGGGG